MENSTAQLPPQYNDLKKFYYLKSIPHPSSPSDKYSNRYVRYTGSGHSDVVLTEAHPVYLKFYYEDGRQLAGFKEHVFGFSLSNSSTTTSEFGNLHAVEMFNDAKKIDTGFYFDWDDGGRLKWKYDGDGDGTVERKDWTGWVLRECPPDQYNGNPQLFWTTATSDEELPAGLERVDLIAEYL
jgi:hypothetical protein